MNKLPIWTKDKAGEFRLYLQNRLVDQSRQKYRSKKSNVSVTPIVRNVYLAEALKPGGAPAIINVLVPNPADGGDYQTYNLLFDTIEPDDISQWTIADCWLVAFLRYLASTPAGREILKSRIMPNPSDPSRTLVYLNKGEVVYCYDVDNQFSSVAGMATGKDFWPLAALKAGAMHRYGTNLYASLAWGWWSEAASWFGCVYVPPNPRNIAEARDLNDKTVNTIGGGGIAIGYLTSNSTSRFDMPKGHIFSCLPTSEQPANRALMLIDNPWAKNAGMGGVPSRVTISDADLAEWAIQMSAMSLPKVVYFSPPDTGAALPTPPAEEPSGPPSPTEAATIAVRLDGKTLRWLLEGDAPVTLNGKAVKAWGTKEGLKPGEYVLTAGAAGRSVTVAAKPAKVTTKKK